jgi:hypothetical protein
MACLIFAILAYSGHGPDRGHHEKRKAGYFEPELMRHFAERARSRYHPRQYGSAGATAFDRSLGGSKIELNFSCPCARRHDSILAAARGTMNTRAVTFSCDVRHQRRPISGGFVDQQLKQLMKELGEAINESLSDSEQIAEVVSRIKEGGYDIFLVLEATIGVSKQGEHTTDKTSLVSTLSTNSELKISDQDLKFLKSLRIKIEDDEDEE